GNAGGGAARRGHSPAPAGAHHGGRHGLRAGAAGPPWRPVVGAAVLRADRRARAGDRGHVAPGGGVLLDRGTGPPNPEVGDGAPLIQVVRGRFRGIAHSGVKGPFPCRQHPRRTGAPTLEGGSMRVPVPGALAAMAIAVTACSGAPAPQVVVAPDAGLTGLQTFRVVESQTFQGDIQPGETGPEIVNSATSRALASQITTELERRGYTQREMDPDVLVEYGTATREALDPSDWNYNYLFRGPEWRGWGPGGN